MKIRDGHATINGDTTEYEMPSGSIDIIAEGGKTLMRVSLQKDGSVRVSAGHVCKRGDVVLDDKLLIHPLACNVIEITRPAYT